ncbi:DOT1-domain-containing protein [Hyphopichia burtonii NRRL Y-1933]|uniref:Histone-lysine N-methyltransferase, H3 lysine-79 specific n=1 Tax=Hyphopichia burtonii NRRL Y-1933 TaxID=984485 RepID=A0A1E4RP40_9ASCO|nr:DOT1-domain-containing protein [Hyphopichia burtonii NRRL Y-1933]ODV69040.1 DOT1-domain-containing protein [Hyphopichia burtonii NRRL Y-1933]
MSYAFTRGVDLNTKLLENTDQDGSSHLEKALDLKNESMNPLSRDLIDDPSTEPHKAQPKQVKSEAKPLSATTSDYDQKPPTSEVLEEESCSQASIPPQQVIDETILQKLLKNDLTRLKLEQDLPNSNIETIVQFVHDNFHRLDWTIPELYRVADFWCEQNTNIQNIERELPLRDHQQIKNALVSLGSLFEGEPKSYFSPKQIAEYFTIFENQLFTRKSLENVYPNTSLEDIQERILKFPRHKIAEWSKQEIKVLLTLLHQNLPIDDILSALIFRSKDECQSMLESLQPWDTNLPLGAHLLNEIIYLLDQSLSSQEILHFLENEITDSKLKNTIMSVQRHLGPWSPEEDEKFLDQIIDEYPQRLTHTGKSKKRSTLQCFIRYWKLIVKPSRLAKRPMQEKVREMKIEQFKREPFSMPNDFESQYLNTLSFCSSFCLTLDFCEIFFPSVEQSTLKTDIKLNNLRVDIDFLPEEIIFFENAIKDNLSNEFVCNQLFYHNRDLVIEKLNHTKARIERKTSFKNPLSQLIYEAKWISATDTGSRRRTRDKSASYELRKLEELELKAKEEPTTKKQKVFTEEENKIREEKALARRKQKAQREAELLEKRRLQKEKRLLQLNDPNYKPKPKIKSKLHLDQILEDAAYFQSVTGNGKLIKDGDKRQRRQATHYIPEFKNRTEIKRVQKRLAAQRDRVDKSKKSKVTKKRPYKSRRTLKSETPTSNENSEEEEEEDFKETLDQALNDSSIEDEDDADEVSPYDPTDILHDSQVPFNGRRFFVDQVYNTKSYLPRLSFEMNESGLTDSFADLGAAIPLTNDVGEKIIETHIKNYRNYPGSFPPAILDGSGSTKVNKDNRVRIRFLLYPQYSELFILAEPKSNELDPIFELQKIFQIHYALYFSYSEPIRDIIYNDFCIAIETAVEEDNFSKFMFIIDSWNTLMLELCPTESKCDKSIDINASLRKYIKGPRETSKENIQLETFIKEVMAERSINSSDDVKQEELNPYRRPSVLTPPTEDERDHENITFDSEYGPKNPSKMNQIDDKNLKEPELASTQEKMNSVNANKKEPICKKSDDKMKKLEMQDSDIRNLSPVLTSDDNLDSNWEGSEQTLKSSPFAVKFFENLKSMTSISRFCLQQLLLRAYTRIVSPDSRKLRSYKAFTAEVYGELLPSFVSEVLTKVNLLPSQKFYDLGSGVGNTTFQAALEFGAKFSGGCELMPHASILTERQHNFLNKQMAVLGLKKLPLEFSLLQSFVDNKKVREQATDCDILIVNNYLFDFPLNVEVGKLLYGLKPGTKIISLRNFIPPRYKASLDRTVFDYLSVEKHEMSDFLSVSWTANKVPYYISTVEDHVRPEFL